MKFDKDDTSALTGTIIIHLILLLILYFGVLKTIVPNEDSGVLVNFGDIAVAVGAHEPSYTANTQQKEIPPPPAPEPVSTAEEKLIAQDQEESVAIPEKKENKEETTVVDERARIEREEAERKRREEDERKRREEEQKRQQEAISNRVSNAFGMGRDSQENNQGDAGAGTGNQGSPFGNSDTVSDEGTGGFGTFNLNGRSIGSGGLPRPAYTGQEEGRIVINITVDPNGNVILAEIGRGTNIDNASMRNSAISAARRAKFNKIQGANNQNGTITYIYKLT
ncbi:MAG: energy transducer TonB [Tannerella sp.]|jgi:TonB family protein|nr:energy transducer TonB [Tannerella sp.]